MKKGFTLIEILIVVAIIAILSSIVLIGLGPAQRAGRDARRAADLRQVQNGLELYFNKCGYYPGVPNPGAPPCPAFSAISSWTDLQTALTGSNLGIQAIANVDPSGRQYAYATGPNGLQYVLRATLDDPNSSLFANSLRGTVFGLDCDPANRQYCVGL